MKDSPGRTSPGSTPSGGQQPDASGAQSPKQPADHRVTDQPQPSAKWSKEQPPPGQWTALHPQNPGQAPPPPPPGAGRGAHSPAGPGGYGGFGSGWGGPHPGFGSWGPPPAAKPGLIPLRPLSAGEILDGAASTMRTYWRTVLGITLTLSVVAESVAVLPQGLFLNNTAGTEAVNGPGASMREVSRALGDTLLGSGVVLLVSLLGTIVAPALLTTVTSCAVLGRPVNPGDAWRETRPQLARLGGLTLLLALICIAIVTVGALPGILIASSRAAAGVLLTVLGGLGGGMAALWIMTRFSLASPALMLEKQGIRKSLSRSAKLVRGSWWRVFGIQLLAQIIASIVASLVVLPFTFVAEVLSSNGTGGLFNDSTGSLNWTFLIVSGIGSVIGRMITFPITGGVTVLLYIDQRIRREALDLDLARAAGIHGYGSDVPGTHPGQLMR